MALCAALAETLAAFSACWLWWLLLVGLFTNIYIYIYIHGYIYCSWWWCAQGLSCCRQSSAIIKLIVRWIWVIYIKWTWTMNIIFIYIYIGRCFFFFFSFNDWAMEEVYLIMLSWRHAWAGIGIAVPRHPSVHSRHHTTHEHLTDNDDNNDNDNNNEERKHKQRDKIWSKRMKEDTYVQSWFIEEEKKRINVDAWWDKLINVCAIFFCRGKVDVERGRKKKKWRRWGKGIYMYRK